MQREFSDADFTDTSVWSAGYSRQALFQGTAMDAQGLRAAAEGLGLSPEARCLIVGSGFGWVAEDWAANHGYRIMGAGQSSGLVCADTSAWIKARLASEGRVPVHRADFRSAEGRAALQELLGGRPEFIITEDLLAGWADSTIAQAIPAMEELVAPGGMIVHWISPGHPRDWEFNYKTGPGWRSFIDEVSHMSAAHFVVIRPGQEVF